jgi:hypothetical protein
MAGEPSPTGAAPEIDYDKLGAALAKALAPTIGGAIADANKPILESLGKLTAPAPAAEADAGKGDGKGKPLTLDDVSKLLDNKLNAAQSSAQAAEQKKGFVADKLKDLPAAYQGQLGNDPSKWAAEEQAIRGQYKADFKTAGGTVPNVGGGDAKGAPPTQAVDTSKLKGRAALEAGIIAETAAKTTA